MDKRSLRAFDENEDLILNEARKRFEIGADKLRKLGSWESFVYEFERDGNHYILKLTHSLRRTPELILSELDWVNFLADNEVPACRAIPSENGNLVEVIDIHESSFIVYAFEKAPGRFPGKDDLNDKLFEKWGRLTGRMHALAKEYRPPTNAYRRFEWYNDVSLSVEKYIPPSQALVIAKIKEHIARLRALPVETDCYGLIHSDLHHSNFFINDGNIIPIDFDDCHYSWYATDIAMPLFYMLHEPYVGDNNKEFARHFVDFFMRGYNSENRIGSRWMKRIPDFMKLREMDLYMAIHSAGEGNLDRWCRDFMKNRRNRIENDIPVIELDFSIYA